MHSRWLAILTGLFILVASVLGLRLWQSFQVARETLAAVQITQPSVLKNIPFGASRGGLILANPYTAQVYAAKEDTPALAAIDGRTNEIVAEIPLRGFHEGITFNPNENEIYIGQTFSRTIRVIDGETNQVAREIPVPGGSPIGAIAFDTNTNRLYVIQNDIKTVAIVDYRDGALLGTLPIDGHYGDLGINPQTERLYVTSPLENKVTVVDTANDSIVAVIPLGNNPKAIALNPATRRVYVTVANDNAVAVIDGATNTRVTTIPVGETPIDVAVNPYTNRVFVSNLASQDISVIDGATNRVAATIPLELQAGWLAVLPNLNRVYVSSSEGHAALLLQDLPVRFDSENLILSNENVRGLAVDSETIRADWNELQFDDAGWSNAVSGDCLRHMPRLDDTAQWIGLPDCSQRKQTALFRQLFRLSTRPVYAALYLRANQSAQVYLNGQFVGKTKLWTTENWFDLTPYLRQGDNALAVRIDKNREGGYTALLFHAALLSPNAR